MDALDLIVLLTIFAVAVIVFDYLYRAAEEFFDGL